MNAWERTVTPWRTSSMVWVTGDLLSGREPSCDSPTLERSEVELHAEARPRRWDDRAVGADLHRLREQPVAPLRRPGGWVERNLDQWHRREGERGVQVRHQPDSVRPGVRRPRTAVQVCERGEPPAPADPAGEEDVALQHVDEPAGHDVARFASAPP